MKIVLFFYTLFISIASYGQEIQKSFSVIIIGGGPAGLSCASACLKAGYTTLVCDEEKRGIFCPNFPVTNWPGHPQMDWKQTMEELRNSFVKLGGVISFTHVKGVAKNQGVFHVSTDAGIFHSSAVVIATGRQPIPSKTAISTEQPTRILSRLYDAAFLTASDSVIIIGNGEYALIVASEVAPRVKQVYLFLPSQWKAAGSQLERIVQRLPMITWMRSDKIIAIKSTRAKVSVEAFGRASKIVQEASWVIFAEEWRPQSLLAGQVAQCDSSGAIITYNDTGITPNPGLFACGEVTSNGFLNGISAAASGLRTSSSVCQYLLGRSPLPVPQPLPKEEPAQSQGPTEAASKATGTEEQPSTEIEAGSAQ